MFFLMADIVAMGMVRDYYSDVWAIAKLCRNVKKIFFPLLHTPWEVLEGARPSSKIRPHHLVEWRNFINPSTWQSPYASNSAASLPPQWGLHVLVTHPRIAAFGEFVDGEGLEPACEVYYGIWQERYGDELAAKAVACSEYKWHVL